MNLPVTNIPEFSVSEISGAVKRTLEGNFARVRVRGEITEFKRYPSGHIYFSLKDEGAKIGGMIWKPPSPSLGMMPENGVEVIATGRITAYGERSAYQLIVERMEYAGAGALLARIEMLRNRLGAEACSTPNASAPCPVLPARHRRRHSRARRRAARHPHHDRPPLPRTSCSGRCRSRARARPERIAAAIAGFDPLPRGRRVPRPDVLIVARGGGSLEDLMAFNEEVVLRAAAACRIPLISAVGHETDTTLIDFVSDRRRPAHGRRRNGRPGARRPARRPRSRSAARLLGGLNRLTAGAAPAPSRANAACRTCRPARHRAAAAGRPRRAPGAGAAQPAGRPAAPR